VSQLKDDSEFPRCAAYRDNQRLNNDPAQLVLYEEFERPGELDARNRVQLILMHGYQTLKYASLGIPHSTEKRWLYSSRNLLRLPHIVNSDLPPPETIRDAQIVTLKEELLESIRKNERND
jgi:hypothetical protein